MKTLIAVLYFPIGLTRLWFEVRRWKNSPKIRAYIKKHENRPA